MEKSLRPNEIINESPMSLAQLIIIIVCVCAMALDGYDVMSIAVAAADMAQEWSLSKAQLGFILPLEFGGMALGAIFLGSLSDVIGRKRMLIGCLVIIAIGMLISGYAPNMTIMGISRVLTGLGIGGMLATATSISSEFSNNKNRSLAVILVAGGYTLGIYITSKISAYLLTEYDWRAIFKLGSVLSLAFVPIVMIFIPLSVAHQERKLTDKARAAIAKTLKRFNLSQPFAMAENLVVAEKVAPTELFKGKYSKITILLILFYVGNILTYYFFIKWLPPAIVDLGYTKIQGTEILGTISLMGLLGSFVMAALSRVFPLKPLCIIFLLSSAVAVAAFPQFTDYMSTMHMVGGFAGFCLFAVISGAFGLWAQSFPTNMVATGTGIVLGLGRGGAMAGPFVGGLLFAGGMTLAGVAPIMAMGSAIAAIAVLLLPKGKQQ